MKSIAAAAMLCLLGGSASANLIVNGSFETPSLGAGLVQSITGGGTATAYNWDWNYITGILDGTTANPFNTIVATGLDGSQHAYLQGGTSSVTQSFTLLSASEVNISWLYAGRENGGPFGGDTTYQVTAGALSYSGSTTSGSNFAAANLSGVLAAGTYTLSFTNQTSAGDNTMFLDNVNVDATALVPEPSSLAVLGIALAGLVGYRRATGKSFHHRPIA